MIRLVRVGVLTEVALLQGALGGLRCIYVFLMGVEALALLQSTPGGFTLLWRPNWLCCRVHSVSYLSTGDRLHRVRLALMLIRLCWWSRRGGSVAECTG